MEQKIIQLSKGRPKDYPWNGRLVASGIGKDQTSELEIHIGSIVGDNVADQIAHGGEDRVVCLYPFEHYAKWDALFRKTLRMPAFGENITASGMTEEELCIGDIYKFGTAVLQVTQGRVPCSSISFYNEETDLLKNVFKTGLTGCFFRVLEEGIIREDSQVELLRKDPAGITVAFATRTLLHEKDTGSIRKILAVEALSQEFRDRLDQLLTAGS